MPAGLHRPSIRLPDDIVLRQIRARLDIEEVRLTRGRAIE
jgi:hypothetical protein